MWVIRWSLSYLSGIISDWVRNKAWGQHSRWGNRRKEVLSFKAETFLLAALFIIHEGIIAEMTLCHKLRRGPSGNWGGGLSHLHYRPRVLVTIRVPWWIIHQERGWGPGLKESIKKMQWGREWWPTSGYTMQPPIANMLEARQGSRRHSIIITLKY